MFIELNPQKGVRAVNKKGKSQIGIVGANLERVAVNCIFRAIGRPREFTSPGNFEANNLLMNKLDELNLVHQPGKLIFELLPAESHFLKRKDIDDQICVCGHNKIAHKGALDFYAHTKACQVSVPCGCRKYKKRQKIMNSS